MNFTPSPDSAGRPSRPARVLRRLVFFAVALATLIAFFYAEEDWRGKRAWEKFKLELEVRGEVLDWHAFIPEAVPDAQNFMKVPLMDAWFNPQTKNTNGIARLRELCRGPSETRHGSNFIILEICLQPTATGVPGEFHSLDDFKAVNSEALCLALSRIAQVPLMPIDLVGGAIIVGGGPSLKPKRVYAQADITNDLAVFEGIFKNTDFHVTSASETNVLRLVCHKGILAEDLVAWFESYASEFNTLSEALKRPYCRFDKDDHYPFATMLPSYNRTRDVARALCARAKAFLITGKPDAAYEDLTRLAGLINCLRQADASLGGAMIRVAIGGLYVSTIGEGMSAGLWGEAQYAGLQRQLRSLEHSSDVFSTVSLGARAAGLYALEQLGSGKLKQPINPGKSFWRDSIRIYLAFCPRGWIYQNQISFIRFTQLEMDAIDLRKQRIYPRRALEIGRSIEKQLGYFRPYNFLTHGAVPNIANVLKVVGRSQTQLNEALVACTLERYRLDAGKYPQSLADLIPRYADQLPNDLITGDSLKYRLTDKGGYRLYSVGWNERDDGGELDPDIEKDDWMWIYPTAHQ